MTVALLKTSAFDWMGPEMFADWINANCRRSVLDRVKPIVYASVSPAHRANVDDALLDAWHGVWLHIRERQLFGARFENYDHLERWLIKTTKYGAIGELRTAARSHSWRGRKISMIQESSIVGDDPERVMWDMLEVEGNADNG